MPGIGRLVHKGRSSLPPVAIAALGLPIAATVLAACSGSTGSTGAGAQGGGGAPAAGVRVQDVGGLGPTLVDGTGKTLYFSEQESSGTIQCTGGCLAFWLPATGQDTAAARTPGLASLQRPDNGQNQLTYQGKPLYTFRLDSNPGMHGGDNFSDDFSGHHFTWHAATLTSAPQQANPAPPSQNGGGYGY